MNSLLGKLAEAIVGELNGSDFSMPFVADWGFTPVYSLKELQSLRVTVVPRQVMQETAARNLILERLTVDIAVQRGLEIDPGNPLARDTQADEIIALAEEIAKAMAMQPIVVDQVRYQWVSCQRIAILQDQLLDEQVATSVVSLTYQTSTPVGTS